MRLLTHNQLKERFKGAKVVIIGSAPSCLQNDGKHIDSHDVVVRVNNYKRDIYEKHLGSRTDVHHSFYGTSIRKSAAELKWDGVQLCMCKCPNATIADQPGVDPSWHLRNNKMIGLDYRYIYMARESFWFTDTYIPELNRFMEYFRELNYHQPTSGMAAIMDFLSFDCESIYLTGFDFFKTEMHNVDEPWPGADKNPDDPYRHSADEEIAFINRNRDRLILDKRLQEVCG